MPHSFTLKLYSGKVNYQVLGSLPLELVRGEFTPMPVTLKLTDSTYFCTGWVYLQLTFANINFFNDKCCGAYKNHGLSFYKEGAETWEDYTSGL